MVSHFGTLPHPRFLAMLPTGYDDQTRLAVYNGEILIAHPTMPLLNITKSGDIQEISK